MSLAAALQCSAPPLALVLIEVRDFPNLQARLGFDASGALLQALAQRFNAAMNERATVYKFGEARFCVLVQAIRNRGHAVLAAERLARAAEEVMADAALTLAPEMNIGVAIYPSQATNAEELLRKAQLAAAAGITRSVRLQVFDESCADQVITDWELRDAFAMALRSGELQVCYQPKMRIADRRPVGVEALMRWPREGQALVTPDVFIPLAEKAGLIQDTTWYALTNAMRHANAWRELSVAVNITPAMLHHRDFVDMVRSTISTWTVRDHGLTLEITEGALIADFEQATSRLKQLRELGVRISIDDFGTGYSSLSYFKKIPADELKIDKSFVMGMLTDDADQSLVQTIITLAKRFRMEVVAEGVEDQATLEMLSRMHCGYAQGFVFAPALSAERLGEWLKSYSSGS